MSSNYPYGGTPEGPYGQNPGGPYGQGMPGPVGPPPNQSGQSPYGYPTQPPMGQPTPGGPAYGFGPFADPGGQQAPGYPPGEPGGPGLYGPGQPFPPPAPEKRGRGKILIIGGAIALALILIGVVAAVLIRNDGTVTTVPPPNPSTSGPAPTSAPPSSAPPAEKASDAVSGYLNALAAGDVAGALSYAADPLAAGPFLTDAVLAESAKRAPLTAIDVTEVLDQNASLVPATYTLGDTDVAEDFEVVKLGDAWKLTRVVTTIRGLSSDSAVPMRINGVKVSGDIAYLLPGSYAFTTGLPFISYGSKNVVLVKSPSAYADVSSINAQLSSAGRKALLAAAKSSYRKCLRSDDPRPKGCPFGWTDSAYSYRKNTVNWTQSGSDPFKKVKFGYASGDASVSMPLRVRLSGSCTYRGRSGTCSGTVTGRAVAIAGVTGKSVKVRWL